LSSVNKAKIIRRVGYLIAAAIISFAALVSAGHLLTPYFNDHKLDFEKWATQLLGAPVQINQVHLSWHYLEPEVELDRVVVLDKQTQKSKIEIQKIIVNIAVFHSFFSWKIQPEAIEVSGVALVLHQLEKNQFHIEGLNAITFSDRLTGENLGANDILAWIFSVPALELQNINIQYVAMDKTLQYVTLKKIELQNDNRNHVLHGNAELSRELPTRIFINANWQGDIADLNHVNAHINLNLQGVDFAQWSSNLSVISEQQLKIKNGIGSFKINVDWNNSQLQTIQTTFETYELQVQSLKNQFTQDIPRLSGDLSLSRQNEKIILTGENIFLDLPNHLWPTTHFSVALTTKPDGTMSAHSIDTGFLDVTDIKNILLQSGFLSGDTQNLLKQLDPTGQIQTLHIEPLDIEPAEQLEDVSHWALTTDFSNITFNELQKYPAAKNLSGHLSWNGMQGDLILKSRDIALIDTQIFNQPVHFDSLAGTVHLKKNEKNNWFVTANNIQAASEDLKANAMMTLELEKNKSPEINLSANFTMQHVENINRYLPLKVFEPGLVTWLKNAFPKGRIDSGRAILQGKLSDFPFKKNNGKFEINGTVHELDLHFAPDWPTIHNITGNLAFLGDAMSVDVTQGVLGDIPLQKTHATIINLSGKNPAILDVQSSIKSDFKKGLEFIQSSPLKETLGKDLSGLEITGPMNLDLNLHVPLDQPENLKVKGQITTENAVLNLSDWNVSLNQLQGVIDFSDNDLQAKKLQARLLNQAMSFSLVTQHQKNVKPFIAVNFGGKLNITELQKWSGISLTDYARGETNYTAQVNLHRDNHRSKEIILKSNLQGLQIILPQPFGKKANDAENFQMKVTAQENSQLETDIDYGKTHFDITKDKKNWQVGINNENIAGTISIPTKITRTSTIVGKMDRFYISSLESTGITSIDPMTLPSLSFVINDLRYEKTSLGQLSFNVAPSARGLVINYLNMDSSFMELRSNGTWQKNSTSLHGSISTENLTKFLTAWGFNSDNFVASKAKMDFDLKWPDAPYQPTEKGLSGTFYLKLGEGRVVNVGDSGAKLGFGRMLSLFSLQTIPRRLSLDFSDLFQKGYSFDSMKGDFSLKNGNAYTQNTRFDGPVARIDLSGRIGLAEKDFGLSMGVTPHVTSSLPVVATYVGGPIAGIATWLVEKMVSREMSKVTTYQYKISGTWDDPQWNEAKN
jgi:uncharacterized protein (TIGR02099 family)